MTTTAMTEQTTTGWTDEAVAFDADTCPACDRQVIRVTGDGLDQAYCPTCGWYAERTTEAVTV